ncbi:o-succinylbenzoate--CoA ligase [Paenibacillus camelliae]|uniref:o-succinylbenzoate--CoA ligase n=1 Tax=Paenibacillus camelliae TaxID=512410 RepID=UPI00203DFD00|nr:o-succinylbenzoate--CoA ligase [Paenibacillus camelliae]MCM3635600.1 o-succinylbenzoate--CoA ligase [Paenibacillus camelliae]
MQIPIWLEKRAYLTPDRIAVEAAEGTISFAELRLQARNAAANLLEHVQAGDVVACLSESSMAFVTLVHSIPYTGAQLMPLNTRLTEHELLYQLRDSRCRLLVYSESYANIAEALQQELEQLHIVSITELQSDAAAAPTQLLHDVEEQAVYTIMYTSGTTGYAKGVLQSYDNHFSSAIGSMLNLGLSEQDKWLAAVPLFHISGLSILLRSVIYGIPIVIQERFSPKSANAAIMHQGVTVMSVVSNMLLRMLEELGEQSYPANFRCMLLGGGPAPLPLLEACVAKQIPVVQTYGMTETCSQFATLHPEYMLTKLGSAGKPLFQGDLRIVQNGNVQPAGEAGEIIVKGPNVTRGYLNGAAADSFDEGWLYTGDIGYVDEEGFLFVLDRRKDMLISGGENVYPAEIESVLIGHPDVLEAGVTGAEHEVWGQCPIAFVVMRPGKMLNEEELLSYCRARLAKYKLPTAIYAVEELPRNASNKLLRRELSKLLPMN